MNTRGGSKRHILSTIIRSVETGEPGFGFYGLSKVPSLLREQNREDKGVRLPEVVNKKRQEF